MKSKISLEELLKSKLEHFGKTPDPDGLWADMQKRLDMDPVAGSQGTPLPENGTKGMPGPAGGAAKLGKLALYVFAAITAAGGIFWATNGSTPSETAESLLTPHTTSQAQPVHMEASLGLSQETGTLAVAEETESGPAEIHERRAGNNPVKGHSFHLPSTAAQPGKKAKNNSNHQNSTPPSPMTGTVGGTPAPASAGIDKRPANGPSTAGNPSSANGGNHPTTGGAALFPNLDGDNKEPGPTFLPMLPIHWQALPAAPTMNAAHGAILAKPPKRMNPLPFILYAGTDLEKTQRTRSFGSFSKLAYLQLGLGYRHSLGQGWAVQPELWFHQLTTPSITVITETKNDLDGERLIRYDTVTILRMSGFGLNLQGVKTLPHGFSLLAGAHLGWYPMALAEDASSEISLTTGTKTYQSAGLGTTTDEAPDWMRRFQPGVKLGIEKTFFRRFLVGASLYQGLADISQLAGSDKNYSTNWMAYLGYRF